MIVMIDNKHNNGNNNSNDNSNDNSHNDGNDNSNNKFMGCRRCRRPIVGSYERGAGESLEIVRAYCPTLSWHEVGMN